MGITQNAHAMAAAAQCVLWGLRLKPRDQAGDLAGADIEPGDHGRALRRNRLHLRRQIEAQHIHASLPLLRLSFLSRSAAALSTSSRAAAAASDWRTVT